MLYKQSSSIAFDETSSYWSATKAPNFSAFHWSPYDSLVSIGQHFVTTNINTEIEIEADLNTESDQAMRAVHSCNSWFIILNMELNDLRKIICLRKYEVFVESISVCNVIENLAELGLHCLSLLLYQ